MTGHSLTEILEILKGMREELAEAFFVRRIGVFGSIARGEDIDRSDMDILLELAKPTFDHYMDLKFRLEDALGRPVELLLADTVKERLRPIIEKEVVYA